MDTQEIVRKEETRKAIWDVKGAGVFFLVLMLLEIPLSIFYALVTMFTPDSWDSVLSILIAQGYLFVGAGLYLLITQKNPVRDLCIRKYKISTFFLSLLILITATPMSSFLNLFSQLFAKNEISTTIFGISESMPFVVGILLVGFLPGLIEETIFRGIMYQAFRRRSILTGIIVSAVSFGLMHGNFNQIFYAIYLGIVFALIVEATGSLLSTMILHMLFNGFNTAYIYIMPKLLEFLCKFSNEYAARYLNDMGQLDMNRVLEQSATKGQIFISMCSMFPFAIGGLVLTVLLLYAIAKINGRDISWKTIIKKEGREIKPVTIPLVAGWIVCLILAMISMLN